ncbi:MAG: rRNA maturation RNase YbeY [Clostridiales bacterium]|nr:rRNA maturation RNase YbeY [Clostridiales bacterium]
MYIYFDNEGVVDKRTEELMYAAAALCAKEEELDERRLSLSVSFVDYEEIRGLNDRYRGRDEGTDVLSFPQFDPYAYMQGWGEVSLGDVVICREQAEKQAEEYGHSFERELIYLFVHSCFHLLGYDHEDEDEKKLMREKEERVMNLLDIRR